MALGLHLSGLEPVGQNGLGLTRNPDGKVDRQQNARGNRGDRSCSSTTGRMSALRLRSATVQGRRGSVGGRAHLHWSLVVLLIIRLAPQALPPEIIRRNSTSTWPCSCRFPVRVAVAVAAADKKPEPPRKAEVEQKKDPISVPAPETPNPTPEASKEPPPAEMMIPFKPMAAAEMTLPGVISPSAPTTRRRWRRRHQERARAPGQGSGLGPGLRRRHSAAARIVPAPASRCRRCFAK